MKKRKIKGIDYLENEIGVLIPTCYVREGALKVTTPEEAMPILEGDRYGHQERFFVVTLDGSHHIIRKHLVTIGLANQSPIHPREVFAPAIKDRAVSILLAHNHPSGNLEPSEADLQATARLVQVSKTVGIPIVDHLIVSARGFISLRQRFPGLFS